ncbi:uncharacterized protein LOC135833886 [Planococcus citri]|uniref:uncharacterized protein LOC135833886 n=1 Tax=Planococcus citri TaxID=170843 RepID=UPI0031F8BEF6
MSRFYAAVVPLMLYAVMSQAAPMVGSTNSQGEPTSASVPGAIPSPPQGSPNRQDLPSHEESLGSDGVPQVIPEPPERSPTRISSGLAPTSHATIPPTPKEQIPTASNGPPQYIPKPPPPPPAPHPSTVTASAPVSVHVTSHPPCQCSCPPNSHPVPCPDNSQSPANTDSSAEKKDEPKKKTGIWNGLKKVVTLVCNSVYEGVFGENGVLTNLPDKIVLATPVQPKKVQIQKQESQNGKSGGRRVTACCIFGSSGPAVLGDESDDETTTKATDTQSGQSQAPPINLTFVRNRYSSEPGAPAPTPAPVVPGAKSKTSNIVFNGCCVGKRLFNVKTFFTWNFKPQINICSCAFNVNGAEVNT